MKTELLYRVSMAAQVLDINERTIRYAIGRGEIKTYLTACGMVLVDLPTVAKWSIDPDRPKPGRPCQHR